MESIHRWRRWDDMPMQYAMCISDGDEHHRMNTRFIYMHALDCFPLTILVLCVCVCVVYRLLWNALNIHASLSRQQAPIVEWPLVVVHSAQRVNETMTMVGNGRQW